MFSPFVQFLFYAQNYEVPGILIALLASCYCSGIMTCNFNLDRTLVTFLFTLNCEVMIVIIKIYLFLIFFIYIIRIFLHIFTKASLKFFLTHVFHLYS